MFHTSICSHTLYIRPRVYGAGDTTLRFFSPVDRFQFNLTFVTVRLAHMSDYFCLPVAYTQLLCLGLTPGSASLYSRLLSPPCLLTLPGSEESLGTGRVADNAGHHQGWEVLGLLDSGNTMSCVSDFG